MPKYASFLTNVARCEDNYAADILAVTEKSKDASCDLGRQRIAHRIQPWTSCSPNRLSDAQAWKAGRQAVRDLYRFLVLGIDDPKCVIIHVTSLSPWVSACVGAVIEAAEKQPSNVKSLARNLTLYIAVDELELTTHDFENNNPIREAIDLLSRKYRQQIIVINIAEPEGAAWRGLIQPPDSDSKTASADATIGCTGLPGAQIRASGPADVLCLSKEGLCLVPQGLVDISKLLAERSYLVSSHGPLYLTADPMFATASTMRIIQEWKDMLTSNKSASNPAILCMIKDSDRYLLLKLNSTQQDFLNVVLLRPSDQLETLIAAHTSCWQTDLVVLNKNIKRRKIMVTPDVRDLSLPILNQAWLDKVHQHQKGIRRQCELKTNKTIQWPLPLEKYQDMLQEQAPEHAEVLNFARGLDRAIISLTPPKSEECNDLSSKDQSRASRAKARQLRIASQTQTTDEAQENKDDILVKILGSSSPS